LQTARDLGLNVNRVCENALIEVTYRLTNFDTQTNPKSRFGRGLNRFLAGAYFSVCEYASGDEYFSIESPVMAVETKDPMENSMLLI
jgi:hypothetical protein